MTIKSFKEQSQVNEMGGLARLATYAPAGGIAVNKAVEVGSKMKKPQGGAPSRKYKGNPYSTPRRSTTNMKPNTAYSPTKSSAKGQAEDVKLDEKNPPEAHVARSKKNPDMFCVFDKDGKEVKLFKDKKDAEAYAVKNHDELMEKGLWANIHKRRKAGKAPKKPGDKGYPKTLDIEAKEDFDGVKNAVKNAFTNISNRGLHVSKGRIKTYNRNPKPAGTPSTASKYSPAKGTSRAENYVSAAQRMAVHATKADGGKGHPDNKKKSKKETVDEISRDDLVKKVSSTIGNKVPTMLNPQSKEKNKVKTGLDRLRKALGPNHVMNKTRA